VGVHINVSMWFKTDGEFTLGGGCVFSCEHLGSYAADCLNWQEPGENCSLSL
jgi:hypothetical protein